MHPLTGIDHMIAMIAVGAWSAQLGGKAIIYVPASFLFAMLRGGWLGFATIQIPGVEFGIALSVLILGIAIALNHKISLVIATLGVGMFGICHGYAHGNEIPNLANKYTYALGFLITTACLHLIGAIGGLIILENKRGSLYLRLCGCGAAIVVIKLII